MLAKVVDKLDKVKMDDRDTKGDVYEYMLGKIASAGQNALPRRLRHLLRLGILQQNAASFLEARVLITESARAQAPAWGPARMAVQVLEAEVGRMEVPRGCPTARAAYRQSSTTTA
jgi:hypothetical protein